MTPVLPATLAALLLVGCADDDAGNCDAHARCYLPSKMSGAIACACWSPGVLSLEPLTEDRAASKVMCRCRAAVDGGAK